MGRVTAISFADRALKLAGALACAGLLGGCGAVELEGKVFDYMGVSGDRQKADVRMTERPGLVVPPNLNALPAPTESSSVAANRQDWPDDPERVRKRIVEEKKTKKAEAEAAADPINPYAGKETLLDKLFAPSKTVEEPVPDVPEPDLSDRLPSDGTVAETRPQPLTPHVSQAPLPDQGQFEAGSPDSYNDVSGGENAAAF